DRRVCGQQDAYVLVFRRNDAHRRIVYRVHVGGRDALSETDVAAGATGDDVVVRAGSLADLTIVEVDVLRVARGDRQVDRGLLASLQDVLEFWVVVIARADVQLEALVGRRRQDAVLVARVVRVQVAITH